MLQSRLSKLRPSQNQNQSVQRQRQDQSRATPSPDPDQCPDRYVGGSILVDVGQWETFWFYRTYLSLSHQACNEMEGSLAKTVRIGQMFSERIETFFPLLLMKRVDQMPDVWMEYLYVMPLVFWDACSCVSSLTAPQRTLLAPQKEIRALRKTCEMVRKDWRGRKYQKPDQRPDVHFQQLPLNYPADIFPSQECLTSWIANKKTCCQRGNYFSPAYRRVSKLVVRKRRWWRDEFERERRWKKWGRMTGVGGLAE